MKKLREQHQHILDDVLAKRLLAPIHAAEDFQADLAQASTGYRLKMVGPQEWRIYSKRDGTRFRSIELRPSGRDLLEQLRQAVGRTRSQELASQHPVGASWRCKPGFFFALMLILPTIDTTRGPRRLVLAAAILLNF